MSDFVHLHLHSEYSLLDGACRVSDIPKAAKEAGHTAVAITDHGVLYGAVAFYEACLREGVKPIIGCEVYVAPVSRYRKEGKQDFSGNHLVLLAENETGYRNLIALVSRGFTEGFYMRPRVDRELLVQYHDGLIALSACLAGAIPEAILLGDYDAAKKIALDYRDIFGQDNFYLEIQNHSIPDEARVTASLVSLSRETGIPLVATNDIHYLRRRDAETQKLLVCIQTGRTMAEGSPLGFETDEFYYKSTEEMSRLFSAYPEAIQNTVRIADRCHFDFSFGQLYLPDFPETNGVPHREVLARLAYEGLESRIANGEIQFDNECKDTYLERIRYELGVIDAMGFNAYYLIVRDFVSYAKSHGIPVGPGRGSGAGSLVAYCIGITDVDSIRYHLLFERFLNPERQTMPDFDIDFCYEKRDQIIQYVRQKYGDDHVAQIVTFGTLAARAAVRDVGRALGMTYQAVDTVAKLIPTNRSLTDALRAKELKRLYEDDADTRRLLDFSLAIEGMPRHASTHAAGIVITKEPCSHYVPLALNGDVTVTQFDMDTVAKLGLVKFDFLGLRYLTVIERAVGQIRESDPAFDILKIPMDDPATYRMISAGKTDGVFQLESAGIKQVLVAMKPSCFSDIIATIALYRPGPMDSIDTFIKRKNGAEPIQYEIPALGKILNDTYGCIVYQEQVMQIFRDLAGYSLARADLVRRAMSKKKADQMAKERADFLSGCAQNGYDQEACTRIYEDMERFASYAFNKSHATAYAILSYRTAYLKAHAPAAFLAALMSCDVPCDPSRFGIRILPPDVNESTLSFRSCDGGKYVRFGLLAIKNVGRSFVESLISERGRGNFTSFDDFVSRMSSHDLNRKMLESMIKCGCFDSFGIYRSRLIAVYDAVLDKYQAQVRNNLTGQFDIFSMAQGVGAAAQIVYPQIPEYPKQDLLSFEKELTGMYFSGHLFDTYTKHAQTLPHTDLAELAESFDDEGNSDRYRDRQPIAVVGFVVSVTEKKTRSGVQMAFFTLEDRGGSVEILAFPKQYETYAPYLKRGIGLYVEGTISIREGEPPKIVLEKAVPLIQNDAFSSASVSVKQQQTEKKLYLRVASVSDEAAKTALKILSYVPGETPVVLYDISSGQYLKSRTCLAQVTDKLLSDLRFLLGNDNVVYR